MVIAATGLFTPLVASAAGNNNSSSSSTVVAGNNNENMTTGIGSNQESSNSGQQKNTTKTEVSNHTVQNSSSAVANNSGSFPNKNEKEPSQQQLLLTNPQNTNKSSIGEAKEVAVVINEVELNPSGNDTGNQWIELYNPSEHIANISSYMIKTTTGSYDKRLPAKATMEPHGTYIVALNDTSRPLPHTVGAINLTDPEGKTLIDKTPSLFDEQDNNYTWQRIPDGNSEWQFLPGTKGGLNSRESSLAAGTGDSISNHSMQPTCTGSARCLNGIVIRIVSADTLYVRVSSTFYKVDLAISKVSSSRAEEARAFVRDLCLGSEALVDEDDNSVQNSTGTINNIVGTVYCSSTNLNPQLLERGYAVPECGASEFKEHWARDYCR
jgi:endonuclease YncB( thermonuclease family)